MLGSLMSSVLFPLVSFDFIIILIFSGEKKFENTLEFSTYMHKWLSKCDLTLI